MQFIDQEEEIDFYKQNLNEKSDSDEEMEDGYYINGQPELPEFDCQFLAYNADPNAPPEHSGEVDLNQHPVGRKI